MAQAQKALPAQRRLHCRAIAVRKKNRPVFGEDAGVRVEPEARRKVVRLLHAPDHRLLRSGSEVAVELPGELGPLHVPDGVAVAGEAVDDEHLLVKLPAALLEGGVEALERAYRLLLPPAQARGLFNRLALPVACGGELSGFLGERLVHTLFGVDVHRESVKGMAGACIARIEAAARAVPVPGAVGVLQAEFHVKLRLPVRVENGPANAFLHAVALVGMHAVADCLSGARHAGFVVARHAPEFFKPVDLHRVAGLVGHKAPAGNAERGVGRKERDVRALGIAREKRDVFVFCHNWPPPRDRH